MPKFYTDSKKRIRIIPSRYSDRKKIRKREQDDSEGEIIIPADVTNVEVNSENGKIYPKESENKIGIVINPKAKNAMSGIGVYSPVKEPDKLRGNISDEVWNTESLQQYIHGNSVWGYIGHSAREPWMDEIVEDVLRKAHANPEQIAEWMTSGNARHLMDRYEGEWNPENFRRELSKDTKNIQLDSFVWNHPDTTGNLSFRHALITRLKAEGYITMELNRDTDEWDIKLLRPLPSYDDFRFSEGEKLLLENSGFLPEGVTEESIAIQYNVDPRQCNEHHVEMQFCKGLHKDYNPEEAIPVAERLKYELNERLSKKRKLGSSWKNIRVVERGRGGGGRLGIITSEKDYDEDRKVLRVHFDDGTIGEIHLDPTPRYAYHGKDLPYGDWDTVRKFRWKDPSGNWRSFNSQTPDTAIEGDV